MPETRLESKATSVKTLPLRRENDVVLARRTVRNLTQEIGCSLIEQTKLVTAASEIARNTLVHGKGGTLTIEELNCDGRRGLRLVFADEGPGIPDVKFASSGGFLENGGAGLGLSGARRLVHEFNVESVLGTGTRVTLVKWSDR